MPKTRDPEPIRPAMIEPENHEPHGETTWRIVWPSGRITSGYWQAAIAADYLMYLGMRYGIRQRDGSIWFPAKEDEFRYYDSHPRHGSTWCAAVNPPREGAP